MVESTTMERDTCGATTGVGSLGACRRVWHAGGRSQALRHAAECSGEATLCRAAAKATHSSQALCGASYSLLPLQTSLSLTRFSPSCTRWSHSAWVKKLW